MPYVSEPGDKSASLSLLTDENTDEALCVGQEFILSVILHIII